MSTRQTVTPKTRKSVQRKLLLRRAQLRERLKSLSQARKANEAAAVKLENSYTLLFDKFVLTEAALVQTFQTQTPDSQ
jgi:hypothetical protein